MASKAYTRLSHPELNEGEVLVTNATAEQFTDIGWRTKRLGEVAYDGSGAAMDKAVPEEYAYAHRLRPVFAQAAELTAAGVDVSTLGNI